MIIRIFKESHLAAFVIVPVIILLFMVISWHSPNEFVVKNPMPLYDLALNLIKKLPEWLVGIIVFLILVSQAFHLNFIIGKHEVLYKNSYLPALFFTLFVLMIPQFIAFHPVLFVNSILIFILDKLFKIYKHHSPLSLIFDLCFLVGVATLIYLPAVSLFLLFAISILILKTFSWRDWVVGATGLLLPFFFAFVYYFWIDGIDKMRGTFFLNDISRLWNPEGMVLQGYRITIGMVAIVMILTMIRIRQNFYKNTNRIRNYQQVIFTFLFVALVSLAVTGSVQVYRFSILTIPVSIMISYYFLSGKKAWRDEVLFWVLAATLVMNHLSVG